MKKTIFSTLLVTAAFVVFSQSSGDLLKMAAPQTLVNDFSGILSDSGRLQLEHKVAAFKERSGLQIEIVTMPHLGDYEDIKKYSVRLAGAWGIGGKKLNKGVLVLICTDLFEMNISTGIENSQLTSSEADEIVNTVFLPHILKIYNKPLQYYQGLDGITDTVMVMVLQRLPVQPAFVKAEQGIQNFGKGLLILIGIISGLFLCSAVLAGMRSGNGVLSIICFLVVTVIFWEEDKQSYIIGFYLTIIIAVILFTAAFFSNKKKKDD